MQNLWLPLREGLGTLYRHRVLTLQLARRELRDRHVGSFLGVLWVFLHPLIQLGVYTLVFTQVFKLKLGGTHELPFNYTVYIFAGFLPWAAISDSIGRSTVALTGNASLVKQVVFPVEILCVKSTLSVFFTQAVGLVLAAGYTLWSSGWLPWTYVLLPALLLLEFALLTGIGWGVAAVGAYFRDLKDLIQVGLLLGVYLIPAFYVEEWVPQALRLPLLLNPFTHVIYAFQDAMYYGRIAHPWSWAFSFVFAFASLLFGGAIFRTCKTYFGSVL